MKFFKRFLAKRKIPRGPYCYSGHLGKGLCEHYSSIIDNDVVIPFCKFLNCGDISNIHDDEFNKLLKSRDNNAGRLYEEFPLTLLWDQVKECGVKE